MFQRTLLLNITEQLHENTSLIEEISKALDISYDAAHRRVSLKSKLSLDEAVLLAKYFNVTLDGLFGEVQNQYVSVEKTKGIHSEEELCDYFKSTYQSLQQISKEKRSVFYYSAKDIPIFYTLKDNRLSHFKYYVWLKLLDKDFNSQCFEAYQPSLATVEVARTLNELYREVNSVEVWDITTINSTLKQIDFYFKGGQLSVENALELCSLLKDLITDVRQKLNENKGDYKLYYNELLLMNNNVLIETENKKSLYVPFSMLSYYLTSDKRTCNQAKTYFQKQLQSSKLLNSSGEKEKSTFFNKMYQKIDVLKNLIKAEQMLSFE